MLMLIDNSWFSFNFSTAPALCITFNNQSDQERTFRCYIVSFILNLDLLDKDLTKFTDARKIVYRSNCMVIL